MPTLFHRVVTIVAASSIVITAVYILRVVGILLLGPIKNDHSCTWAMPNGMRDFQPVMLIVGITAYRYGTALAVGYDHVQPAAHRGQGWQCMAVSIAL